MARKQDLIRQVLAQTEIWKLVQKGDIVCCALSGGADSVCLLHVMLALRPILGIRLTAVHVNHNLRGAESEADAAFCEDLCRTLDVPLTTFSVDVKQTAAQEHCSVELAARRCRYAVFAQVETNWIVTAHTASDNTETLIHRLVRGASLHGLTAIPPVNGRFLRPLLNVTREEVESYLYALGQPFVMDRSNLSDDYTRNQIRHHVIPPLQMLNPSVEHTTARTIQSLRRDDDFMRQQTEKAYAVCHTSPVCLEHLTAYHPAIQVRCIAKLLETQHLTYDSLLLEKLLELCQTGGRWNLHGNVYAVVKSGKLMLETFAPPQPKPEKIPLQWGENQLYPGFLVTARLVTRAEMEEKNENLVKTAIVHEKFANC